MTANYFLKEIVMEGLSPKFDSEWKDVKLYTPLQSCQSLLNEHAECVAVEAFLKMASLPFQLVERPNVEYMSPSGEAPFLKLDNILVPGFDSIVEFVGKKGVRLSAGLTNTAKADLEAHIAFIEESLRGAELYMLWLDEATYTMVTKERYGIVFSWPLCSLLPKLKRRQVRQYLTDIGWAGKTMDEVVSLADRCFKSLSSLLGQKEYFMGDAPTELDALAFGHIYSILTTELPNTKLVENLRKHANLSEFCKRIDVEFFTTKNESIQLHS